MDFRLGIFSSSRFSGMDSGSGRLKEALHLDGYGLIDCGFGERLRQGAKIKDLIKYKWIFVICRPMHVPLTV
jgi:hypothetical protein